MSNWERRPLRKSQAHYAALDAYVLIDIVEALMAKAQQDGLQPFEKFVKTLDTRNIIINEVMESDDDREQQRKHQMQDEHVHVKNNRFAGRQRKFNNNNNYEEGKGNEPP